MDHLSYCDPTPTTTPRFPVLLPLQKHNMDLSYCPGIDWRLCEEAALAPPVRSFPGILKEKANFIKNTISTKHSFWAAFRRSKHDLKPAACSVGQRDGTNQWGLTSSWGKMFFFICVGAVAVYRTSRITFITQQPLQRAHKNVRWQTLCYFLCFVLFFLRKLDLFFLSAGPFCFHIDSWKKIHEVFSIIVSSTHSKQDDLSFASDFCKSQQSLLVTAAELAGLFLWHRCRVIRQRAVQQNGISQDKRMSCFRYVHM